MKAPLIAIARHRLTVDGEGVTTLVAFHGCPLRCRYCLNRQCWEPEGISHILAANMPAIFPPDLFDFGIVEEIEVEDFGGVRPLKYSDVKGVRMIQGIGVATWNDGECIFGPLDPYKALPTPHEESRHYRSMLVHFERNNEVLYDVWPKKEIPSGITIKGSQSANQGILFDLQGRKVNNPKKGIYIKDGRKVLIK